VTIIFLTKDLPLFIYPVSAAMIVSATSLVLCFTTWWRSGLMLLAFVVAVLWLAATPFFSNWLNWRLESEFPPVNVETLPQSDAVILLGGVGLDLDNPANRIKHALQIYRAGKAPLILYSGGNAKQLVELGVPSTALISDSKSRNTWENAVNTAAIFKARGWRSGILVTSAAHICHAPLPPFKEWGSAWCRRRLVSRLDRPNLMVASTFRWIMRRSGGPPQRSRRWADC
jgi:DUF218 domain